MTPIDKLIDVVLIYFVTQFVLTAVGKWLATEEKPPLRFAAMILWTAVVVVAFKFLFGNMGASVAIMSSTWYYLRIYAEKNKVTDDKDK